jgi:hypothetical protein
MHRLLLLLPPVTLLCLHTCTWSRATLRYRACTLDPACSPPPACQGTLLAPLTQLEELWLEQPVTGDEALRDLQGLRTFGWVDLVKYLQL